VADDTHGIDASEEESGEDPAPRWRDYNPDSAPDEAESAAVERVPFVLPLNETQPESPPGAKFSEWDYGRYKRLWRHERGTHRSSGDYSTRKSQYDKIRISTALCNSLDLNSYQTKEVSRIMAGLNLDRFGNQKRVEKVALAVIKVFVNRDRFERQQNLDAIRISQEPAFKQLMDDHEISGSDLYSVSQLVKKELKRRGYYDQ
jgi:hypothetical protein